MVVPLELKEKNKKKLVSLIYLHIFATQKYFY